MPEGKFAAKAKVGLSPEQKEWLRQKAYYETARRGQRVSEAEVLRELIDAAITADPVPRVRINESEGKHQS